MEYLGSYTITPNTAEIEVCCFGTVYPAQKETLEQEGFSSYAELERVEHNSIDITDYLSDGLFWLLNEQINSK